MAKQGISNRESPQEEMHERDEFPPSDPGLRDHNNRRDERSLETSDEDEFEESEDDLMDDEMSEDEL